MSTDGFRGVEIRPAGYAALIERFGLKVMPNGHESFVLAGGGTHLIRSAGDVVRETYVSRYWPGDGLGNHLEFAIKYDGTNLAILAAIYREMDREEFIAYVRSKPMGKYARRLWYLYEFITGERLAIDDLVRGSYVDLLDPDEYITSLAVLPIRRQRVNDNLMGTGDFARPSAYREASPV